MAGAEEKIKVVVRVRNLIAREKDQLKSFTVQDATDIVQKSTSKSWTFDRVYSQLDNNRTVYTDTASEIIESTVSGFNTTIFAYGQTSSGKTHTMHGSPEETGVVGMAVEQLFYAVEDSPDRRFLMQVAYMEIYNETVIDLLSDLKTRTAGGLKVRENEEGDVYVEGLEQKTVTSPEEIHRFMKLGEKSRHVGQTKMNDKSSRSHTIFRITLESTNRMTDDDSMMQEEGEEGKQVVVSQLNLVDLAGSEKAAQTGAGGVRLKEGCNINQSLMVLGQVIGKLSGGDKGQHINFRDSKLTRILQNSIGGNAKTAIICTVTPAAMSEEQTISTLRFASQAKTIQNHATVNEVLDDQAQINRLKKEMAQLLKELEQQKKEGNTDMVQEMREQLEREKREKEEHVRKIRDLQEKVITSSQPAPPRKSMMFKKKERRETWCGPAMKRNMRMSYAPHKFTKPLLPLDFNLPMLAEDSPHVSCQSESLANLSLASADFNLSHTTLDIQLRTQEARRMEELDMMEDEASMVDDSVFEKKRCVKFVQSPQFLSPRRKFNNSIIDLNLTDNGTPKAVIRDKYKRVSIALTSREVELDRERQARIDIEREHLELQEFTRLESESGVDEERRMSVVSGGSDSDMVDRLRWLEKSYKDGESLNLQLGKQLAETRQECNQLKLVVDDFKENLEVVTAKEEKSSSRLVEVEPLVDEVKELREKTLDLEKNKMDFEMQLELALEKKEVTIVDLRKYLESAFEEIATLENGDKVDVKSRFEKMKELSNKVNELELEIKNKNTFVEEAESMKDEFDNLKEGMEVVTAEMDRLSEDKIALEKEINSLQTNSEKVDDVEFKEQMNVMESENARLSELNRIQSFEISNMELSNASLLETVDDLSRKTDEAVQNNSELLVASAEMDRFNLELKEEMSQLKAEVKQVVEFKNRLEEENQELRSELEEVVTSKSDLEEFINRSQNTEEIEVMKKEMKQMEEDKTKLEILLKNEERSQMMTKFSATLNCIEESFISAEEINKTYADKTCADESPSNATFANSTFGVPLEVVEEMKNQLLYLQQQLVNFSPEELESKVKEIQELKTENSKLQLKLSKEQLSPTDIDLLLAEKTEELQIKHKAEISIISTKMREEINFNLPALEEKLRDEFEEKKQQVKKDITTKYEEKLHVLQEELKNSQEIVAHMNEEMVENQETLLKATQSLSNQKNTTLGVVPLPRLENLNSTETAYTTCEMSFDETIGNSSINLTMGSNTVLSGGIGDSLQVQMLKGELESVKESLEEKERIVDDLEIELTATKTAKENSVLEKESQGRRFENIDQLHSKISSLEILIAEEKEEANKIKEMVEVSKVWELKYKEVLETLENKKEEGIKLESIGNEKDALKYQETIRILENSISEYKALRTKGEEYISELTDRCENYDEIEEKSQELEDRNEEMNKKLEENQIQFESYNSNIELLTTQIKALEELVESKSAELEKMNGFEIDKNDLLLKLEEVSEVKKVLELESGMVEEKLSILHSELINSVEKLAEFENIKLTLMEKEKVLDQIQNQLKDSEALLAAQEGNLYGFQEHIKMLTKEKSNLVDEFSSTKDKLEDITDKHRNLEEGLENAMADLESAIIDKETTQEQMIYYEERISELSDQVDSSKSIQEEQKSLQHRLCQELENIKINNDELLKSKTHQSLVIDNLAVDAKRFEEIKTELEDKIVKMEESCRVLAQEKENEKSFFEKCLQDAKSDSTLVTTMSGKLQEMEAKFEQEVAVKVQLELHFTSLLDNLKEEKTSLEKHLNSKEAEYSTLMSEKEVAVFRISEEKLKLDDEVSSLQSGVYNLTTELDKVREEVVMLKSDLKFKVQETLEGEASLKTHLQSLLESESRMSSLKQEVLDLQMDLDTRTAGILEVEKQRVAANEECEKLKIIVNNLEDSQLSLDVLKQEIVGMKEDLEDKIVCLNEFKKQRDLKHYECDELKALVKDLEEKHSNNVSSKDGLKEELESLKYRFIEVEKQRDTVDDECDKLEAKLVEAEVKLKTECQNSTEVVKLEEKVAMLSAQVEASYLVMEENRELQSKLVKAVSESETSIQYQDKIDGLEKQVERLKFDLGEAEKLRDIVDAECDKLESELEETKVRLVELNNTCDQPNSLASTMIAGHHTLLNNVSMDCTYIPGADIDMAYNRQLEVEKVQLSEMRRQLDDEKEQLVGEIDDLKRQLASTPTEEKYTNLKVQLVKQKEYSDSMYEENQKLLLFVTKLQEATDQAGVKVKLEKQMVELKEELGRKNIEFASLKVDVERGELEYKKKCEILQCDLDYEKSNSNRLTQEIRRFQSSAMDTTVIQPKQVHASSSEKASTCTNTSVATAGSPVWSSGSGAIKEIRLHTAEMRVKSLEKENGKLKEHEEFYINKAREWKSRALKYEKVLEKNGVEVPSKENRRMTNANTTSDQAATPAVPPVDPANAKIYQAAGLSPRTSANPLQDLQNLRAEIGPNPPTPTEDIKLVLSRRSEPRRTEEDFRLPAAPSKKKPDDCKQQ